MKTFLYTTTALALLSAPALAQEIYDLGEITIFTNISGEAAELDRTGATVDVITEEELERAPSAKVADVLRDLPGVTVSANGGLGGATNLRIRGLDGKYVKVLVDGIDVTDPSGPQTQFDWGQLTTGGISRIEVLKGSASSIYGSRAIGGVINITTKRPTQPGTEVQLTGEAGSYDTYRAGISVAHQGDRGGAAFSLNRIDSNGFSARAGAGNTEPDGFGATQFNFSGDYQATDTLRLGLSGFYLDAEGEFDEFFGDGAPPYDEFNDTLSRGIRAFAELQTGAVLNTVSASYFSNDRSSTSNGFTTFFNGDRTRFDYRGVYDQSEALSFSFGGDWEEESFDSGTDSGTAETLGIFGEALYSPTDALDLAFSLRWDDHSDFGSNLSGRIAAAYRITDATILRAVASTGFRAPSLYELNSTLYGNPALQPEESVSYELGIEHQFGGGSFVKATAFHTEIDNLIQFVTLSFVPFTGQYQQVAGTSTSQGVELSGAWALNDRVRLFGNYTYTDTQDATGAQLLRVPEHNALVGLDATFGHGWSGDLTINYVADRAPEFGVVMEDYTLVNAAVRYDINDDVQAYLRVENLMDEQYQTSAGYNASDRALFFGVRATF